MLCFRRPTGKVFDEWLQAQGTAPVFTTEAGIPEPPPRGFRENRRRSRLGQGEAVYRAACQALVYWEMFPHVWITIEPRDIPAVFGQTVAVVARCLGIWTLNACRVIDVSERTEGTVCAFGLTYATVGDHAMRGAERFAVVWHRHSDDVFYELASYSRPQSAVARLAYPYVRWLQKRFARHSCNAMARAVQRRLENQDSSDVPVAGAPQ
jgi:uncharacterized protein (UPF0548 family)